MTILTIILYIFIYIVISFFVSLWHLCCEPFDNAHPLIGVWWPILLIKELVKSFCQHVLEMKPK